LVLIWPTVPQGNKMARKKRIETPEPEPEIELDYLLSGNPSWEQVAEFFKLGEFDEENYLVAAIKKHLRTPEQKKILEDLDLSIEDCLNGRYGGDKEPAVDAIYTAWNEKLGFQSFGSGRSVLMNYPQPVIDWLKEHLGCSDLPPNICKKLDSEDLLFGETICVPSHSFDLQESNIYTEEVNLSEIRTISLLDAPCCTFYKKTDKDLPAYLLASWSPGDREEFFYYEF